MKQNINHELKYFWAWAGSDFEEYKNQGWRKVQEPFEYPEWECMVNLAKAIIIDIKNDKISIEEIIDLLTIMALDNESEEIMDFMEETLTDIELERLLTVGLHHELMDARWQIAELLGRKRLNFGLDYLERLLDDNNSYVTRRALLSINSINPNRAEELAYQRIENQDEYIRLVSLRILIESNSKHVGDAINMLRNDTSEFIRLEIERYLK